MAKDVDALLAPVRAQHFIVYHDAFQYFETAFGLTAAGALSISDASPPSPARLADIRARVSEGCDHLRAGRTAV
ncbi:MAG: zinc ABC transporter substrate-binding protein [Paracoccaceae bacterium]